MVQISEVIVISVDKNDDAWAIEGEIIFESDLSSAFSVNYSPEDDELEELEIEMSPGKYDKKMFKELLVSAAYEYED